MTHTRRHGGYATQAKRRGEDWIACTDCTRHGGRRAPVEEDPPTAIRIAGMVIFVLVMFAAIAYGLPILDEALRS